MATKAIHLVTAFSLAVTLCLLPGCSRRERTGAPETAKDKGAGQTIEPGAGTIEPGYGPVAREVLNDAAVTARVKAKLLAGPRINTLKIDVETTGGQVTLSGKVASAEQRSEAEILASQADGVKSIVNLIQVADQTADPRPREGSRESPRGRR